MLLLFSVVYFIFLAQANGVEYFDNTIVGEYLEQYENSRLLLDVVAKGNDTFVYMEISEPITVKDDFRVNVVAIRFDGVEFPIPGNPIKLCELLAEELAQENEGLTQFQLSRIFNLDGIVCPILPARKRLIPYLFPSELSLYNDMGCGEFVYKTTIEDCKGGNGQNCTPLISATTTVILNAFECSNTLM